MTAGEEFVGFGGGCDAPELFVKMALHYDGAGGWVFGEIGFDDFATPGADE